MAADALVPKHQGISSHNTLLTNIKVCIKELAVSNSLSVFVFILTFSYWVSVLFSETEEIIINLIWFSADKIHYKYHHFSIYFAQNHTFKIQFHKKNHPGREVLNFSQLGLTFDQIQDHNKWYEIKSLAGCGCISQSIINIFILVYVSMWLDK